MGKKVPCLKLGSFQRWSKYANRKSFLKYLKGHLVYIKLSHVKSSLIKQTIQQKPAASSLLYAAAIRQVENAIAKHVYRQTQSMHLAQEASVIANSAMRRWITGCLQNKNWEYRGNKTTKAALHTIAKRRVVDFLRRASREPRLESLVQESQLDPKIKTQCNSLMDREQLELIRKAIPADAFEVLWRYHVNNENLASIAVKKRKTYDTVKKYLRYWMKKIAKDFQDLSSR